MRNSITTKLFALAGTAVLMMACDACEKDVQEVNVSSAPLPGSADDFKTNVKDRVFFALNKSKVTAADQSTVDAQSKWLNMYPQTTAAIEGHCDQRGTREYNLALGARRAEALKNELAKHGVSADRLSTISYGKDRPPVDGPQNETTWAQQRTAITVVN